MTAKVKRNKKDGRIKRVKINDLIALSVPVSRQFCCVCNQLVEGRALIIYLNHATYKLYDWVHIRCVPKMNSEKFIHNQQAKMKIPYMNEGCSLCDKRGKMISFVSFRFHKECIPKLIKKVKQMMDKHGPEFFQDAL